MLGPHNAGYSGCEIALFGGHCKAFAAGGGREEKEKGAALWTTLLHSSDLVGSISEVTMGLSGFRSVM